MICALVLAAVTAAFAGEARAAARPEIDVVSTTIAEGRLGLRAAIEPRLLDLGAVPSFRVVPALDMNELFEAAADPRPPLRLWIEITAESTARVLLVPRGGRSVLSRLISVEAGRDPVAGEQVAAIVATAIASLLDDRPPAPPVGFTALDVAPSSPDHTWRLGALASSTAFANGAALVPSVGLTALGDLPVGRRWRVGLWASAEVHRAAEIATSSGGVRLESMGGALLISVHRTISPRQHLGFGLGPGLEHRRAHPLPTTGGVRLQSPSSHAELVLAARAMARWELALAPWLSMFAAAGGEALPLQSRYFVTTADGQRLVIQPRRVRPTAQAGLLLVWE